MPRSRRRRQHYQIIRNKYSNETYAFGISRAYTEAQPNYVVVSKATDVLGTRKAKNFTLTFQSNLSVPFWYCLVFVPEGTDPGLLHFGATVQEQVTNAAAFYNPNQNVILQGIGTGGQAGVTRVKTRLARNLNSGDKLVLIIQPIANFEGDLVVAGTLNYAISY